MKLTIILLTVAIVQVSAKGLSQTVSFNCKNTPLQEVLSTVKKQTGFSIAYNGGVLDKANLVSLNVTDIPLKNFLQQLFHDQPLDYSIKNKTIFISPTPGVLNSNMLPVEISSDLLQAIPIKGQILDADGKPLGGASITIKGSKNSTSSGADGSFSLNASEGNVLIVSYVGYSGLSFKVTQLNSGAMTAVVLSSDRQSSSSETDDEANTAGGGFLKVGSSIPCIFLS